MINTAGLEFFAVDHCNLRCYGCAQSSPFVKNRTASVSSFYNSLDILKDHLRPQKLTILGGEPLLHPRIHELAQTARASQMFNQVRLVTNGLRLLTVDPLLWSNIDLIRISVYPSTKVVIDRLWPLVCKISSDHGVIVEQRPMDHFNQIVSTKRHSNEQTATDSFRACIYKTYCHTLADGFIYRCSPSVHMGDFLHANGSFAERLHSSMNRLRVQRSPSFCARLAKLLSSEEVLEPCHFCFGSSGERFPHRQLSASSDNPHDHYRPIRNAE